MTIFTKTQSDEEKKYDDNTGGKTDADMFIDGPRPPPRPSIAWSMDGDQLEGGLNRESGWFVELRQRRNTVKLVCCCLLLFWLFVASFFAGVLVYRHFDKRATFHGWCGTNYMEHGHAERLEQRLEIDENEDYEQIEVPPFAANRPATFIHDFRNNVTAIEDILSQRCFVKPLDREHITPPTSFIDLVRKMESGYYEENPRVIRHTYRIGSKLNEAALDDIGSQMVKRHCRGKDTFLLKKASNTLERPLLDKDVVWNRQKRDATGTVKFSAFNGYSVEIDEILGA